MLGLYGISFSDLTSTVIRGCAQFSWLPEMLALYSASRQMRLEVRPELLLERGTFTAHQTTEQFWGDPNQIALSHGQGACACCGQIHSYDSGVDEAFSDTDESGRWALYH